MSINIHRLSENEVSRDFPVREPLLRYVWQCGYLPFVVSQRVLLLVLVNNIIIRHQGNLANICCYDIHGLSQARGVTPEGIPDELGSFLHGSAKMVNSRSRLTIEDIVWLDAH